MVIKEYRHFDQVKRVEKSPKAKQGYPCKIPTPTVIQSVAKNLLERHRCSYHKLGDLSTTLEMTFFEDRHFDQTKCVEKSPKAKQYHTLLSTYPILSFRA